MCINSTNRNENAPKPYANEKNKQTGASCHALTERDLFAREERGERYQTLGGIFHQGESNPLKIINARG